MRKFFSSMLLRPRQLLPNLARAPQAPHVNRNHHPRVNALLNNGLTIDALKKQLRDMMGVGGAESAPKLNTLNTFLGDDSFKLPARSIRDSFLSAVVPLGSDERLREKYMSNNTGNARYGRLLEDMDIFAVMVMQKYILNPRVPLAAPTPYTFVTVMLDSMVLNNIRTKGNQDVRISGHIINVGRTTAEVVIWLEQQQEPNTWQTLTHAKFLMAARYAANHRPAFINPLGLDTLAEVEMVERAKVLRQRARISTERALAKVHPTDTELMILHELFLKSCSGCLALPEALPSGYRWMGDTQLSSTVCTFPEDRNFHGTLFGGYLMRRALELAHATVFMFARLRATLQNVSRVHFHHPIAVGSIVQLHAKVACTKGRHVQVAVYADATHGTAARRQATNTLQFTFALPQYVQQVFPRSYTEAMQHLDAKRTLEESLSALERSFDHIDFNKA